MTVMSQDAMMITDEVKVSSQAGALQGCLATVRPRAHLGTPCLHLPSLEETSGYPASLLSSSPMSLGR